MVVWPPTEEEHFPASRLVSLSRHQVAAHLSQFESEAEKAEALAVLFALHPPALRETLELHQDNP